ncbi:hypothetical protein CONCODRAFT_166908 [Conidiobolus coronatus NRRL 28638]|uniref:Uncharacterized protein n=1 Tax=Conidiobolus coronatus (strain ATCC 28846 / CBS 209.66 / NRRL 28638) TaxID=796925 RepID=A0A137NYZ6_CONC2|nr:hypothetical protein CONCODRAFT_166908 [Conidiobolus coronatus NRRL 28638]|eukprot:KXN68060.1 hypothetical protein CONCODRAFT_166908 [Conidiobolus coronatus NRRL 28638]
MSPTLCGTSLKQSVSMANARSLNHDGDNGIQHGDRLKEAGFTWSFAAEKHCLQPPQCRKGTRILGKLRWSQVNLLSEATCFGYGQNKQSIPEICYSQNFASPSDAQAVCYVDNYSD